MSGTSTWIEHLLGAEGLHRVFAEGPVIGDALTVTRIHLGPGIASIALVLDEYPGQPHPRWRASGFDAVACQLDLIQVDVLEVSAGELPLRGRIDISRADGGLAVTVAGAGLSVRVHCQTVLLPGHALRGAKRSEIEP